MNKSETKIKKHLRFKDTELKNIYRISMNTPKSAETICLPLYAVNENFLDAFLNVAGEDFLYIHFGRSFQRLDPPWKSP